VGVAVAAAGLGVAFGVDGVLSESQPTRKAAESVSARKDAGLVIGGILQGI
jgi:hypothetical protein